MSCFSSHFNSFSKSMSDFHTPFGSDSFDRALERFEEMERRFHRDIQEFHKSFRSDFHMDIENFHRDIERRHKELFSDPFFKRSTDMFNLETRFPTRSADGDKFIYNIEMPKDIDPSKIR